MCVYSLGRVYLKGGYSCISKFEKNRTLNITYRCILV